MILLNIEISERGQHLAVEVLLDITRGRSWCRSRSRIFSGYRIFLCSGSELYVAVFIRWFIVRQEVRLCLQITRMLVHRFQPRRNRRAHRRGGGEFSNGAFAEIGSLE